MDDPKKFDEEAVRKCVQVIAAGMGMTPAAILNMEERVIQILLEDYERSRELTKS